MQNLLSLTHQGLRDFVSATEEKPFRGTQLFKWIHQHYVDNFSNMSNLPKPFRQWLETHATIVSPDIVSEHISTDGTIKWLMAVPGGSAIETVFIPEKSRGTLCISSQIGCSLACTFCSTGKQGFNRNLSTNEIIGQLWRANKRLKTLKPELYQPITNVVFMGMGEPLLNFDAVTDAAEIMLDDDAYGLSKYKVTLSTSGLVPLMEKLKDRLPIALAVSLHAPTDDIRDIIVPINKKYPLATLIPTCKHYFSKHPKRKVVFEYVMLKGVNDQAHHAKALAALLSDVSCKINLIPFNPFPNTEYECSSHHTIMQFSQILQNSGFITTIRKTRGDDIDGACGQLVGKVEDLTFKTASGRARKRHKT